MTYLKTLIEELTEESIPAQLYVDNQSSIRLIKTGQMQSKSKHINIRYHIVSQAYESEEFKLFYCETGKQLADIFTKPLKIDLFTRFRSAICNPVK